METAQVGRVCRVCMAEPQPHQAVSLEEDSCALLRLVAAVRVSPGDGLPQQLCSECALRLDAAVDFRRQCEHTDRLLHQLLSPHPLPLPLPLPHSDVKHELPSIAHYDAADVDVNVDLDVDHADYDDDFFMFKVEPETQLHERVKADADAEADQSAASSDRRPIQRFKPFACSFCRKSYSNAKSLRRHVTVHTHGDNDGDGYKCDFCDRVFARRDHLDKHRTRTHADKVHEPDSSPGDTSGEDDDSKTVGRVTTSGGGAVATIKEEQRDGDTRLILQVMYKCAVCNIQYDNQHSYAAHMTKHSGPLPKGQTHFSCTLCDKVFAKRKNLKQHLLTHNEEKANKCTLCHRAFTRPDQLILHMNNHTGKKRHQCVHCDKGFNMLSTLKDHLRTHSGEKPYLCSICGKGFSQNTNLKQHLMRHSAIKPFDCLTCQAKFVSKGELDAHLRKHTGEHPFVCDTCGTGFTTSSSLVKHRRIHSGERPYACDLCSLRFTALGTLKNHRRTHTGEKPFECSHCGRAFTQKSDMVSHVRTHTGEKPYVCTVCGTPFQQSSTLKSHFKTHHPQLKKPPVLLTSLETITLTAAMTVEQTERLVNISKNEFVEN